MASIENGSQNLGKSFDAVVFDVLKVSPEQFAVSRSYGGGEGRKNQCNELDMGCFSVFGANEILKELNPKSFC